MSESRASDVSAALPAGAWNPPDERCTLRSPIPSAGRDWPADGFQRTREVIDMPRVPVEVTEHVLVARICPTCERRRVPRLALDGVAVGRQRLGVGLMSLIATLREEERLPVRDDPVLPLDGASVEAKRGRHRRGDLTGWRNWPDRRWPTCWSAFGEAPWCTPTRPAGVRAESTATCGRPALPGSGTRPQGETSSMPSGAA